MVENKDKGELVAVIGRQRIYHESKKPGDAYLAISKNKSKRKKSRGIKRRSKNLLRTINIMESKLTHGVMRKGRQEVMPTGGKKSCHSSKNGQMSEITKILKNGQMSENEDFTYLAKDNIRKLPKKDQNRQMSEMVKDILVQNRQMPEMVKDILSKNGQMSENGQDFKPVVGRSCPKCRGYLALEFDEILCVNCGFRLYADRVPPARLAYSHKG